MINGISGIFLGSVLFKISRLVDAVVVLIVVVGPIKDTNEEHIIIMLL